MRCLWPPDDLAEKLGKELERSEVLQLSVQAEEAKAT
jgi:hypothetical protein